MVRRRPGDRCEKFHSGSIWDLSNPVETGISTRSRPEPGRNTEERRHEPRDPDMARPRPRWMVAKQLQKPRAPSFAGLVIICERVDPEWSRRCPSISPRQGLHLSVSNHWKRECLLLSVAICSFSCAFRSRPSQLQAEYRTPHPMALLRFYFANQFLSPPSGLGVWMVISIKI